MLDREGADRLGNDFREFSRNFRDEIKPLDRDHTQVERALGHSALAAFAGELAIRFGILPLPEGETRILAMNCCRDWLENRGSSENGEIGKLKEQTRYFFETSQDRFRRVSGEKARAVDSRTIYNIAGYRQDFGGRSLFYVPPSIFKGELCRGFSEKWCRQVLFEVGWLEKEDSSVEWLENGSKRVYTFNSKIFGD
ncbi:MAG: hypothetical protein LBI29_02650 [Rickettsiales bacterium]|jgi:uncharacterized protein (DUF927 family)|nr:hypothetical protein [Rickettsiales bacterium]